METLYLLPTEDVVPGVGADIRPEAGHNAALLENARRERRCRGQQDLGCDERNEQHSSASSSESEKDLKVLFCIKIDKLFQKKSRNSRLSSSANCNFLISLKVVNLSVGRKS